VFGWFGRVSHTAHTRVDGFAVRLKEGHLAASRCRSCGLRSFPPRADCPRCLAGDFELVDVGGRARLLSFTRIHAAPSGFEDLAPYSLGVAELEELGPAGRVLAWLGPSIAPDQAAVGMAVRVIPRLADDIEQIRVDYTLEAAEDLA
jgi:hypothetical protein